MPAASPLSIFILIPLRPAPVSLSRPQSAGHLSFSICSIYLASFFLLLAPLRSAPHRRRCLPNKLACRFVDFYSLPYLSADKRAAAAPCIRTELVFKVLLTTWVQTGSMTCQVGANNKSFDFFSLVRPRTPSQALVKASLLKPHVRITPPRPLEESILPLRTLKGPFRSLIMKLHLK